MSIRHIDTLRHIPHRKGLKFRVLSHQEAAEVRRRDQAPGHRLPASEYTRILLAAKDGSIPPGEADRRISKNGGRLRITPLPKPPHSM